ncbi:MAG: relaxase/mobilization nuclease domain-containing protein [Desulfocapsaceae bacterium]|nr:relaxase/mobilization nuclease domain-containing protein [Desulfocapsaceae bacterium]
MIAKRIDRNPENDSYRSLGKYIADASHEGEKLLFAWHAGCYCETYETALVEIEATQEMNTRCKGEKTYHLMVSFRPEDESKLTPEVFKDIEAAFAQALGFEEHQRLCGIHRNTNNMHMHVAYNMIHPKRFTKIEPFRDFYKLGEACRAMEVKHGLVIDNGISKEEPSQQINQRAASMEAHSGEESFQSYVMDRRESILQALKGAASWQDLHASLAIFGIMIKPHANGMAVVNIQGKEAIKASAIDRSLSKMRLAEHFGEYVTPSDSPAGAAQYHYDRKPLQSKSPERDRLYEEYKKILEKRQAELETVRQQNNAGLQEIKELYAEERKKLSMKFHSRPTKTRLRQILQVQENKALEDSRANAQANIRKIQEASPFHNWNGFLKWQADRGNETALSVLRSRKPQSRPSTEGKYTEAYYEALRDIRLNGLKDQEKILATTTQRKLRSGLIAISQMKQLASREDLRLQSEIGNQEALFSGVRHSIDNNGILIFRLASGGTIRDTGKKLYFSMDETTRNAALIYGQMRFGKGIKIQDNIIERKPYGRNQRNRAGNYQPFFTRIKEICGHRLRQLSQLDVVRFGKRDKVLLPGNACGDLER